MAIGVGLAVAFVAAGFWLQLQISKRKPVLAPALMVASLVVRLALLAAVLILLGVYTKVNVLAMALALGAVYTIGQVWIIRLQVKQANKAAESREGSSGAKAGGSGSDKSVEGA